MIVYIVLGADYTYCETLGVYKSLESAENCKKRAIYHHPCVLIKSYPIKDWNKK